MNPEADRHTAEAEGAKPETAPADGGEDALAVLRRIERSLEEIRGRLETTARTQRHQAFSYARLLGALCEALVVGLVLVALAGWAYRAPVGDQLVELALAGVLQLAALTAFLMARGVR